MKELEVIFVDNHILVVNKPAGLLTQPDRTTGTTCKIWLRDGSRSTSRSQATSSSNLFIALMPLSAVSSSSHVPAKHYLALMLR